MVSSFDNVNHAWLVKFLRQRIGDERVIRLIIRMLKAGIMEDGLVTAGERGTPQGSIVSPLLSNIYLHYVLDLWFQRRVGKRCRGEAYLVRFADDFLACFQYKEDAEIFHAELAERLKGFNLQLAEEKTKCIPFGRFARKDARRRNTKPEEFNFLGFTFFCGKNRYGKFKVKRKTAMKKLRQSLTKFTEWMRRVGKFKPTGECVKRAIARLNGHLNYYAITDNAKKCSLYVLLFKRIMYKWLNRRSQRKSYNWKGYKEMLKHAGMPQMKIKHNLNPYSPTPNV